MGPPQGGGKLDTRDSKFCTSHFTKGEKLGFLSLFLPLETERNVAAVLRRELQPILLTHREANAQESRHPERMGFPPALLSILENFHNVGLGGSNLGTQDWPFFIDAGASQPTCLLGHEPRLRMRLS